MNYKMLKTFAILFAVLPIMGAACQTTQPVRDNTVYVVVEVPETLIQCDKSGIPRPPNSATATNQQTTEYMEKLRKALIKCGVDSKAAREYIANVKAVYEELQLK